MTEKQKMSVVLDDVEYFYEDMKPEQQVLVRHLMDINQKIDGFNFQVDQLLVTREAFLERLRKELTTE